MSDVGPPDVTGLGVAAVALVVPFTFLAPGAWHPIVGAHEPRARAARDDEGPRPPG